MSTDRRWLDLCISLRDHDSLAPAAREALRLADPAVTRPALDAARRAREEQARRAPALVAGSLLRRYQRGEHRAVWRELAGAGPLNDAWRAEAAQVTAATMERVRDNAERLAAAMIARGWPVPPGTAVPGPDPEAGQHMEQLEQALGMPVPPALSAFWHVVGEIELVPDYSVHKSLPDGVPGVLWGMMDPLEIHGCVSVDIGLEEWRDQQEGAHPEAALLDLWVSRDGALKMGASGSTNAISLPFAGADPVVHDSLGLRFTDYLRRAFENKGFLGDCRTMYGTGEEKPAAAQWLASVEFEPVEF